MTAREAAERHADNVVAGNLAALMGDFAGTGFNDVMATGGPPQPTTKWEILSETPDDDAVVFHVCYSNDDEALHLQTRWQSYDGVWKIAKAHQLDA